jgi:GTPase SAR1 family protein
MATAAGSAAVVHAFDTKHKTLTVLRCRVAVLGDAAVGKTALARLLASGEYPKQYIQTSAIDTSIASLPVSDNVRVELFLSDVPGGVIYNSRDEHSSGISTVQAIVIVFDIANKESFTNAAVWLRRALGAMQKSRKPLGKFMQNGKLSKRPVASECALCE